MDKNFWRGKKVFITGHTGFKGGWLSIWLVESGADVTGYSLKPETKPNLFETCSIEKKINSIIGDVRDEQKLKKAVFAAQPDIVFHFASQPLVLKSYENPVETYETNLMGTVNILNAIRDIPSVKGFINVTSDKCYANDEKLRAFKEDDPMGGYDPYSSSKACSELITAAYRTSFFKDSVAVATARAGNVIGGGDWALNRIIPDFIKKIQQKEKLVIRNPRSIRPWQFVLEPLNGYLILAEKLLQDSSGFSESWNFGPNEQDDKTVEWLISKFDKEYEDGSNFQVALNKESFHESKNLKLDCSKSIDRLNWSPKLDIEKSILMTCEWYKNFYKENQDMYFFSAQQIKHYESI